MNKLSILLGLLLILNCSCDRTPTIHDIENIIKSEIEAKSEDKIELCFIVENKRELDTLGKTVYLTLQYDALIFFRKNCYMYVEDSNPKQKPQSFYTYESQDIKNSRRAKNMKLFYKKQKALVSKVFRFKKSGNSWVRIPESLLL